MRNFRSMGIAMMASLLGMSFGNALASPSARVSTKTLHPQSKASKDFHIQRAADKRARKATILHKLADAGSIGYSPRHLGIEPALRPSIALEGYSVSDLLTIGRERGLKVTTKMTKAKLIEVIQAG